MANDENTAKAPSRTVVGLTTGYKWSYGRMDMDLFGRIDNLFDREYVGSVIVNESNGRYYEPAPGRNYGIGLNLAALRITRPFPADGSRDRRAKRFSLPSIPPPRTPANHPRLTLHPLRSQIATT